jgi:hypothetical protein
VGTAAGATSFAAAAADVVGGAVKLRPSCARDLRGPRERGAGGAAGTGGGAGDAGDSIGGAVAVATVIDASGSAWTATGATGLLVAAGGVGRFDALLRRGDFPTRFGTACGAGGLRADGVGLFGIAPPDRIASSAAAIS